MGLLTSRSLGTTAAWGCLGFLGFGAPYKQICWNHSCMELLGLPGLWGSLLADLLELQLRKAACPSWLKISLDIVVRIGENRLAVGEQLGPR
ncbi:hypothetical protein NDU88_000076 [Pleurodeles waltl]|uniref:Secreted protein n=1 Tax=Pleurodeles waltl TaxID=8319 RepID=A0AAV7V453_PLEWA|nr:hypothetical protein NDU88_000076 [Pleurodeles waltl]